MPYEIYVPRRKRPEPRLKINMDWEGAIKMALSMPNPRLTKRGTPLPATFSALILARFCKAA
jgi:hypothetical protein